MLIDESSFHALNVAEQYAKGGATDDDLTAAREAVWDVIMESSWYKGDSAWESARGAARGAAWYATWKDAWDSAWYTSWESANGAARYACRRDVAEFDKYFYPFREYQRDAFLQLVTLGTLPKVDTWKSR